MKKIIFLIAALSFCLSGFSQGLITLRNINGDTLLVDISDIEVAFVSGANTKIVRAGAAALTVLDGLTHIDTSSCEAFLDVGAQPNGTRILISKGQVVDIKKYGTGALITLKGRSTVKTTTLWDTVLAQAQVAVGCGSGSGTDDQVASEVPVTPVGNLAATDVQAGFIEHQSDIDAINAATPTASQGIVRNNNDFRLGGTYMLNQPAEFSAARKMNWGSFINYIGKDSDSSQFVFDGVNRRLGIGIVPSDILHINSSTAAAGFRLTSTNTGFMQIRWAAGESEYLNSTGGWHSFYNNGVRNFFVTPTDIGTANSLRFGVGKKSAVGEQFLVSRDGTLKDFIVSSTGLVGIQTTPSYILDINGTGAVRLPNGTTAQRPTIAAALLRYNSTISKLELSDGTSWYPISQTSTDNVSADDNVSAEVTSTVTAVKYYILPVNSTGGAVTINPPSSPSAGDWFGVVDSRETSSTLNITIDFVTAIQKLYGTSQNYVINLDGSYVRFTYVDATVQWVKSN